MPFSDGNALLGERNACKYLGEPFGMVGWQLNSHGCGVDYPTKHCLHSVPRYVTLLEIFYGDWLTTEMVIVEIVGTEDLIYGLKEQLSDSAAVFGSLANGNKIVNEDIYVGG